MESPNDILIYLRDQYAHIGLPPGCLTGTICEIDNENCLRQIASSHEMEQKDFITQIMPATDGNPALYFSVKTLRDLLSHGQCATHVIEVHQRAEKHLNIKPKAVTTTHEYFYTYPVFTAIMLDEPLDFYFYLTQDEDVVFKVHFKSAPGRKTERYFKRTVATGRAAESVEALANPVKKSCENLSYTLEVATKHIITHDTFNKYYDNFGPRGLPVPKPHRMSWNDLLAYLVGGNCDSQWARLIADDEQDNNDIISKDFISKDKKIRDFSTIYSIELFYGIRSLTGAIEYRFYKGMYDDGKKAMLMEVICEDGSLQYFDLSNEQP